MEKKRMNRRVKSKMNRNKKGNNNLERQMTRNDVEATSTSDVHKSSRNDITWYNRNPELLKATSNISFNSLSGYEFPASDKNGLVAPGVAIIDYVHGIPAAGQPNDVVNVAARKLFADIRKDNSGYAPYDSNDVLIYLLSLNEVYVAYSNVMRAVGLYNSFDVFTRYQPRFLIEALGFDYDDMINNLPGYRSLLAAVAAQVSVFAAPKNIAYFERQFWLPSGIYTDSANHKAQLIAYRPYIYRVFNDQHEGGGALETKAWPYMSSSSKLATLEDVTEIFKEMIDGLTNSADTGLISGDIRRAVNRDGSGFWYLPPVTENYLVLPSTDYIVLSQIENIQLVGSPQALTNLDITQNNALNFSTVVYTPTVTQDFIGANVNPLILAHTNETGPEFVIEATRMKAFANTESSAGYYFVDLAGTEFVTSITIYNTYWAMQIGAGVADAKTAIPKGITEAVFQLIAGDVKLASLVRNDAIKVARLLYMYAAFDWLPPLWLHITESASGAGDNEYYPMVDLDNYASLSKEALQAIHLTAALSLFDIVGNQGK